MSDEPEEPWRILASRLVHDGSPWIKVFQDTVKTGSGRVVEDFHRVEALDFALVFARDPQGGIIVLRQWRQGPRCFAFSFPGGHLEPGEDPAQAAVREFAEETGFTAREIKSLGRFAMHSNFGVGWGNFFLAESVAPGAERNTDDLETSQVRTLTTAALESALTDGSIATVHDALCARLALAAEAA